MSEHTPGPWSLSGRTVYALDETGSNNRFSVMIEGGWTYRSAGTLGASGDRTSGEELQANAALISAAPDLLEALEREMKRESTRYGSDSQAQEFFRKNNARALAAIAKARLNEAARRADEEQG